MMLALTCLLTAGVIATGGGAIARVDGVKLTQADLGERASELRSRGLPSSPDNAVESLVLDVLLANEARRVGLAQSPAVRARIARETRRAAARAMLDNDVSSVRISEEDLKRLYHTTADSVRIKTLAFPSEDAARVNLALAKRSGVFEDAERSAVPGLPGTDGATARIRGQLQPALADLAFSLPVGAFGGPVELSAGWGIVKVLERNIGDEAQFKAQRESIARFAQEQARDATGRHLKEQLRRTAKVTLDENFLKSLGKRQNLAPTELDHVVASVNGETITYREVEPAVRSLIGGSAHLAGAEIRKQIINMEIEDRLLEKVAVERGFAKAPSIVARAPAIERRVLATALVEQIGASVPRPSDKDVRAFYKANVARSGASLESTRAKILEHLLEARTNVALEAKRRELRERAAIEIDRKALQASLAH